MLKTLWCVGTVGSLCVGPSKQTTPRFGEIQLSTKSFGPGLDRIRREQARGIRGCQDLERQRGVSCREVLLLLGEVLGTSGIWGASGEPLECSYNNNSELHI